MCGIIGYIGSKSAREIVINGLKKLEYRGYDSAGIALVNDTTRVFKCAGRVRELEDLVNKSDFDGTTGIGHTRWATHGEPNELNAHPQVSFKGNFIVVHNGIIENYSRLKKHLESRGVVFTSQTDTEVLANLIEHLYLEGDLTAEQAITLSLSRVEGAYGLLIICTQESDKLFAAKKGSPLVIGVGDGENFIASDATPIVEYTQRVIYLNDDDLAIIKKNELILKSIRSEMIQPVVKELDLKIGEIDKEGFAHFMLKEIFEQPRAIHDTFRGRLLPDYSGVMLGGLFNVLESMARSERIIIIACGTSWHAGLLGEYIFEEYTRIPVEVEYASEFRYRNPIMKKGDVVIAISQSGETADTLAAVKLARENGATVIGICNVVGSSIPRETDAGVYTHAGPEIGVASTKAFTTQVTVLAMMAFEIGHTRGILSDSVYKSLITELVSIPDKIKKALEVNDQTLNLAAVFQNTHNALYLGRGYLFPVALEGALKLKEISYIHAEGYPAAEMKHGPIALIDENMPVVVVATKDDTYEKIISNIQEIKARKGIVIAIVTQGDEIIKKMADYVIEVPETLPALSGLLAVIPLQLLSYHIAVLRGCNVDQPRNLAKSVTVE
ncbi:MAG: glutamine--fructose-6-phosphate aminotransferase [Bacteroidetes bacterium GWE2_41_25]|nr:MAG: glutamine--fructose-6-phosphate aminotransferase [Bacteroidetes bacterium GWA2_40_15]OFX95840.1 MAG: glutamine--fructose-6-phosphate aminotransferase [Bacteroidetes bacterium GWC2_40_22]OFY11350.1 MAG: glutamine--fructose-6-phosphate aminotransferase [Bacteroidetes bacterium GWE2_41_25]HBH83088.1 glutamine--fructose-6-phosphate transaminase (isomerizing) [Bacteroidales bacterium]HBQ84086.1 glutamine--fructose-6-phosphate transaminase (isomerizing) [Bacteroidales bacterium]